MIERVLAALRGALPTLAMIGGLIGAPVASAGSFAVTLAELDEALATRGDLEDVMQAMVLDEIAVALDEQAFVFDGGALLDRDTITDHTLDDGCNSTVVRHLDYVIRLAETSRLALSLDSLHDPVVLELQLDATLDATGRVRQAFGVRLVGSCVELGRDTFDVSARGIVSVPVVATLELNPVIDEAASLLRLTPTLDMQSEVARHELSVDVDDSVVRRVIEEILERELDDALGPRALASRLDEWETAFQERLRDEGAIEVELPEPTDAQVIALYERLTPDASFDLTLNHLSRHRMDLLAALLLGDDERLSELTSDAAVCELTDVLSVDLPVEALHATDAGVCRPLETAILRGETGELPARLYADAACLDERPYVTTDANDFCSTVLEEGRIGNAASRPEALDHWSLSPGTRFDIGALSLVGASQPYVRRENFRTIDTPRGRCELEIRIYRRALDDAPAPAVIAFHGGSWKHRQSGFIGIEAMATHFTDAGFVVFMPFYRLIGDEQGNVECRGTTVEALLSDTEAALDWVLREGERFGVVGEPTLFGQSAGGHLAAWLAVERPDDVANAALFYPPVDFADFVRELQAGRYQGSSGPKTLAAITGTPLESITVDDPVIVENSFPSRIVAEAIDMPPLFLLHGEADSLLPFRQSVRLCNALSGDPAAGPAPFEPADAATLRRIVACDAQGSTLHLVREGRHALDACAYEGVCRAGGPESAALVADSVDRMLVWIGTVREGGPSDDAFADAGGGGASGPLSFAGVLWWLYRRRYPCRRAARWTRDAD